MFENHSMTLQGRRILVTRARHQAGKLSDGLRALGAEPLEVPVLEIQPPASFEALDRALQQLDTYDWLIFTSANTVQAVLNRASQISVNHAKIAAVGQATAAALRKAGLHVDYIPENYVAESLIDGFPEDVAGKRILLARAAVARDVIPDALCVRGAEVHIADAYRNGLPAEAPELLRQALLNPLDAATFTSSSAATHLAEAAAKAGIAFPFANVPAISIGPITSETLRELGWPPAIEADPHDIPGLIAAAISVLS